MTVIKILVVCLCAAIGTGCGYAIMLRYKREKNYIDGVVKMIDAIKHNISYRRDKLKEILVGFLPESAALKKNIDEYVEFLNGSADKPNLTKGSTPAAAYDRVCELFDSLGASDERTQIDRLNGFSDSFIKLKKDADERFNKYGGAAVKLGFLFGLGVGVLIL